MGVGLDGEMRWIVWLLLPATIVAAEESVEALARKLHSDKPYERWEACEALRKRGPAAKAAVPALIEALRDEHCCADAAMALGKIAPRDPKVVVALVAALDTAPLHHRVEVVRALGASRYHPALPWLLQEARTNAHGSAERARVWIQEIVRPSDVQVDQLTSDNHRDREAALFSAVNSDSAGVALAVALQRDESPFVRRACARILGGQPDAGPLLVRALPDPDPATSEVILEALHQHSAGWGGALVADEPARLRLELGQASARLLLLEYVRDEKAFEEYARAVAKALSESPDPVLIAALKNHDARTQKCAALLLGYLARDKEAALKALHAVHSKDPLVRAFAEVSAKRLAGE